MRNAPTSPIYIKNKEIDRVKWDKCISGSSNGLIYAYSFYLDAMSRHWDALILNDYEWVMPLTWNRKMRISYLYQPFFTASLGIFGNNITAELVTYFLENIPSKYKYWDISLNHSNLFKLERFKFVERTNYILPLNQDFDKLTKSFSQNHTRNINKATRQNLHLEKNIGTRKVIEQAKLQLKEFSLITSTDLNNLNKVYKLLHTKNKARTYGVSNAKGQLLSSCILFFSHNRIYYILAGNHPDSKSSGSSHYLISEIIREFAGQDLVFDFEGSDVKSIAKFYAGFGAREEKYPAVKLNRLPPLLKLFKK
jgi:hypothetical protein